MSALITVTIGLILGLIFVGIMYDDETEIGLLLIIGVSFIAFWWLYLIVALICLPFMAVMKIKEHIVKKVSEK